MSHSFRDRQFYFIKLQKDVNNLFERKSNPERFISPDDLPEDVKNRTYQNSRTGTFLSLGKGNEVPNLRKSTAQLKIRQRRNERAKNKVIDQKLIINN